MSRVTYARPFGNPKDELTPRYYCYWQDPQWHAWLAEQPRTLAERRAKIAELQAQHAAQD